MTPMERTNFKDYFIQIYYLHWTRRTDIIVAANAYEDR